jgi:hypothetical protein
MYTVSDMMRRLRSKLQEHNSTKVTDENILDALNQGQDFCFDIIARRYPDSIAVTEAATLNSDNTITIPEGAFEQRLTQVYRNDSDTYTTPLERVDYRWKDDYIGRQDIPTNYAILKNKVHLLPSVNISNYTYRIAYVEDVETLVKDQGQIQSITVGDGSTTNASITVDTIGSAITNDADNILRFVNIVDAQTGLVKVSLEVKSLDATTGIITFKLTQTRTTVLNKTIANTIPTDVEVDDYICLVTGSCVPYFKKPSSNYILQFATTEIKRSLGMDSQMEESALRKYEEQLEKINSKRENTTRVTRKRRTKRFDRRY